MKIFLIGLATLSVSLSAKLVTVDPDEFAIGADISTASSYVTLSSEVGGAGLDGKVYVAVSSLASTGDKVYANSRISPTLWLNQETNGYYLRADFTSPTNYVSIDVISDTGGDHPSLWLYTSSGNTVKYSSSALDPGQFYPFEITRPTADIVSIRVGGQGSRPNNAVLLDNLKFEVPEPATCLILLSGWLLLKNRKK